MVGAILCSLTVSGSLILSMMAMRWDVQHRRDVQALKFLLHETEARVMCWRAIANRWNRTREDIVPIEGLRGCVEWELRRQAGGARRSARERALTEPEKVKHDQVIHRASGPQG